MVKKNKYAKKIEQLSSDHYNRASKTPNVYIYLYMSINFNKIIVMSIRDDLIIIDVNFSHITIRPAKAHMLGLISSKKKNKTSQFTHTHTHLYSYTKNNSNVSNVWYIKNNVMTKLILQDTTAR